MKPALVSIVVVNCNRRVDLDICLMSLKKIKYPNFEVILVDDGSIDGSIDLVKRKFKWVKLIENETNIGPIKSRNIGVQESRGEFVAFLDSDTEVDPKWVSELMKVIEIDKKIGACACKVKLFSNRKLINSAGMGCDIYGFAFSRGLIYRGNYEEDKGQYDKQEKIFSTYAAAMIIRKSVLEKVGYLNPNLGMYYEEIELSWKVWLMGYKIVYVPTSVVYHNMSVTKTPFTIKNKYYTERNRLTTMVQNYSLSMLVRVIPVYFLLKLAEFFLYLVHNKHKDASALARGIFDAIKNMSITLKNRKCVQKIRKVGDKIIVKHMERYSVELSRYLKGYGRAVLG